MELPDLKTPLERLRWAAEKAGCFKAADLARKVGDAISESGVRHNFNGTRPISLPAARIYERKLNVPWHWLIHGGNAEMEAPVPDLGAAPLSIAVPEVDVRAGMGGGGVYATEWNQTDEYGNTTSADNVKAVWNFPATYVRDELRSQASKVWLIEVKGDSMEPTLYSGDRVMVDTSDTVPSPGGIFALNDGLAVVVKRLDHIMNTDPPMIRVISDNEKHGEDRFPLDDIKIIGRVVWFGRRL